VSSSEANRNQPRVRFNGGNSIGIQKSDAIRVHQTTLTQPLKKVQAKSLSISDRPLGSVRWLGGQSVNLAA
jgi:hypothetical protein